MSQFTLLWGIIYWQRKVSLFEENSNCRKIMLHFKLWPRDRGCSQSHRTQRTSQMRCQGLGWPQDPFWSDKVKIWSEVFCFHLKRHSFPKTIISVKPIWGDFFFFLIRKVFEQEESVSQLLFYTPPFSLLWSLRSPHKVTIILVSVSFQTRK